LTPAKSRKGRLEAVKDVLARLAPGVRGRMPGAGRPGAGPGVLQRYLGDASAADIKRFPRSEAVRNYTTNIPTKPGW
ncbi:hypothetical protein, partial [Cellulomonas sp. GbtcB1]|uniref:hypothetical protein n=1 Tax=Cellulomonas sp. GbtcB1 TaxID=2824746 RepID=UPI001C2F6802